MEFKITRQNFLEGLLKTQGVVERKTTKPILSNILIEAEKTGIKLTATDLEVAILSHIPAQVVTPGTIMVLAKSLTDIVREINQMDIHISLQEADRLQILAGSSTFTIPALKADDFPKIPEVDSKSIEVNCKDFSRMLEMTAFCVSASDTRLNLSGVLFEKAKGSFRMVATDGHRLALSEKDLIDQDGIRVIVPRKGVAQLRRLAAEDGTFELGIGEKNLFARKGNETLFIRLIDGVFPDYGRVIPESNEKFATISKSAFMGALRRVSLLADERSSGVLLAFSSGHLGISVKNSDLGEANEEFEISYKGEKLDVGFNAKYFLDALNVISGDEVILALHSDLTPCVIKSEKDSGFLSVIMPMRI